MISSPAATTLAVRPAVLGSVGIHKPWFALLILVLFDFLSLMASFAVSIAAWSLGHKQFSISFYISKWPVLAIFLLFYWVVGLYRIVGFAPVEELRRLVIATTGGIFFLVCLTFLARESAQFSRGMIIITWMLSIVLMPIVRLTMRPLLGKKVWFSQPAAILGAGRTAGMVIKTLKQNPGLGLRPVVAFDDNPTRHGNLMGVPVISGTNSASTFCRFAGIDYAIIVMPDTSRDDFIKKLRHATAEFPKLLLIPGLLGVSSLWVSAKDLGGTLGLEIRDNLLRLEALFFKRLIDVALIIISIPVLLPLCLILSLLVKLSSEGPIFYAQKRVGKNGTDIHVLKFRTMVKNADVVLQKYLKQNPHLKEEWRKDHKLKEDPRITFIGRFLRRTSLDELPQLWNVVKGEMSLVGPRPIVAAEIERFGDTWDLYTRVLPGITGLWQVSGRNNLTYNERIRHNEYYVRNWSVWLDLYILFKTIRVLFTSDGAY